VRSPLTRPALCLISDLLLSGVYRGHFRMDQYGKNLNRYYLSPSLQEQPSIFAVQSLLNHYSPSLALYLDLHAHASKRGCFIYGNVLPSLEAQVQNQLYCKLIALNTPHFDYTGCLFSRDHMTRVDAGDGLTAEGSGRVSTFLTHGLVHSYTLECNYNMSKVQNEITPPTHDPGGCPSHLTPPSAATSSSEKYTPGSYEGVGRACLVALLDLRGWNPCSRLLTSRYKTLERLRFAIISEVKLRAEYRGQVLSMSKRRAVPSHLVNHKSKNQEEAPELFQWCRRVEAGVGAGDGTHNGPTGEAGSESFTAPWFISSKLKRKGSERRGEGGGKSLQESCPSDEVPSHRQPTTCSRANDGLSIFPMISNESDAATGATESTLSSELRQLKLLSGSTEMRSRVGDKREKPPPPSRAGGLVIPTLFPRGPKTRPIQSFARNNVKEMSSQNQNPPQLKIANSSSERSGGPHCESTLIMTGRSVATTDGSSSSYYREEKESESEEQMTGRGTMNSRAQIRSRSQKRTPEESSNQLVDELTTVDLSVDKDLVSKFLDAREDYVPFAIQRSSPRRPQSSNAHRAVSM
jgi:hypothetical protein